MILKIYSSVLVLFFISLQILPQQFNGKANPDAMVISGNVRFTVLTPHIIRMEWSEDGKFINNPSLTFINRNLPVPKFEKQENDTNLEIKTEAMILKYKVNSGKFNSDNLSVEFEMDGIKKSWKPGTENKGNLFGTTRTLDGVNGATQLEQGLLSRDGWTLVDDSERPLFDDSDWPWVMPRPEKQQQDFYFFTYGYDYKTILKEFTEIAGKIALPPKFAFGYWWSRYWKYTDWEFQQLVDEFKIHNMPLDVLVIDMDWHLVNKPEWFKDGKKMNDQANQSFGWTGFTWNKSVFHNPGKFLDYTNNLDLKTCMNLHPASGIQPHEEVYPVFAKAMGIDPATKKYVPFDITNKKYAQNYLDLVLHPMESDGIDFWWLDWQQWSTTTIKGVNPTFYLNYVHFSDMERRKEKRPLLYHRWGGLGNHRYQIGFSGDTHVTWESLQFQPYFTATASNVCYGFWSHDIGGHMSGDQKQNPELYTRWIQWGAFSPILRTHASKDPVIERRMWAYSVEYFYAMRDAVNLRYSLLPYIYTSARKAYDTGISMLRPMYYDYPKEQIAYEMKNQYMFGNDILAAPITHPLGKDKDGRENIFTTQKLWLPEGEWIEWSSGTIIKGGKTIERPFTLNEIPLYVKTSSIIPMSLYQSKDESVLINTADEKKNYLILNVFPGDSGSTKIYDDEGDNENFKEEKFSFTEVTFIKPDSKSTQIKIHPVTGSYKGMSDKRAYEIRLPLSYPPTEVEVNGNIYSYNPEAKSGIWNYDGNDLTTYIFIPETDQGKEVIVDIKFSENDLTLLSGKKKLLKDLKRMVKAITNVSWSSLDWDESKTNSDSVVWAAQTGNRITDNPEQTVVLLKELDKKMPELLTIITEQAKPASKMYKPLELLSTSFKN